MSSTDPMSADHRRSPASRSMLRVGVALLAAIFVVSGAAWAITAEEIVREVEAQPAPDASAVKMRMTLISNRGSKTYEKERTVEMFAKRDEQEGSRSLLVFKEPADVAGVSLLVSENPGGPNDQWLYMPALKQEPKRISGGQRNSSFLGTDFTFADLEGRDPENWNHKLVRTESIDGEEAWVLETTPKEGTETQYTKLIQWIRKDVKLPVRIEFYDRQGKLKVLTVEELKQIDGFWTSMRTRMENVRKNHATVLEILEQKNNLEIPEKVFTTRYMKKQG